MKCTRASLGLCLLLTACSPASPATAPDSGDDEAWLSLDGSPPGSEPTLEIVSSTSSETVVDFALPGFYRRQWQIDPSYDDLVVPGGAARIEVGSPALPTVSRWIALPAGATATLSIESRESKRAGGFLVRPVQPQAMRGGEPSSEMQLDERVYSQEEAWPAAAVEITDFSTFRKLHIARLQVTPLRFDPGRGELEITSRLRLTVHHPSSHPILSPLPSDSDAFEELYASSILNYAPSDAHRRGTGTVPERMLVICADRLAESLTPLVEWKQRRGIVVEMLLVSTVGESAAAIRASIREAYEDRGKPPLTYVLLVGNAEEIPVNWGTNECASDSMYAMVAGDDIIADVLIGRIAADSVAQAEAQVAKTLAYEMEPPRGEAASWLLRGSGIASSDGSPTNDDTRADRVREKLLGLGFTTVDKMYRKSGLATPARINANLENGRGFVTYFGHGSGVSWASTNGEYGVQHARALENQGMTPIIVDISCLNGGHTDSTECLAEAFMHRGSTTERTGAVAMFSSSTSTAWDPSGDLGEGVAYTLASDRFAPLGRVLLGGLLYMKRQNSSADAREVWEQFNLFGDPSMLIWTGVPLEPEVTLGATSSSSQSLAVEVRGCDGRGCRAVAGASVVVLQAEVVSGFDKTGSDGRAEVALSHSGTGPLELVVTGAGLAPYSELIGALPAADCGALALSRNAVSCTTDLAIELGDSDLEGAEETIVAQTASRSLRVHLSRADGRYIGVLRLSPSTAAGTLMVRHGDEVTLLYNDRSCDGTSRLVEATAVVDCRTPVLSEAEVAEVTSAAARVRWRTDEAAIGTLYWGTTQPPAAELSELELREEHTLDLLGLSPSTTYYLQLAATDAAGNRGALEAALSFTTPECVPSCTGRRCGPDGCGGSCGSCPAPQSCDAASGACMLGECQGVGFEGCCAGDAAYYCLDGRLHGHDCGNAGCGWTGDPDFYWCGAVDADPSGALPLACPWVTECQPSCSGRCDGDDGCGGICPCASTLQGKLVINEVLADPPASTDVNGDGTASIVGDELIEIVNTTNERLDLSGIGVADLATFNQGRVRYTFPPGTLLAAKSALVLWGATVPLSINNSGDTLFLLADGAPFETVSFGSDASHDESLTRQTDGDPEAPLVRHSTLPGGLPYSPGRRNDGSPF